MSSDRQTAQDFLVSVSDGDTVHQIQVGKPTNLLQILLDGGFHVSSSCRNGVCGSCGVWLDTADYGMREVKSCKFVADTSLSVTLPQLDTSAWPDEGLWVARAESVTFLSVNIVRLELKLPPGSQFDANPGQFVAVNLNEVTRYFSIFEHDTDSIKFIIKLLEDGEFSDLLKNLSGDELFRVSGPFGRLQANMSTGGHNYYFMCTGTGIVPVYNLLKNQVIPKSRVSVFWGNRYANDFFMDLRSEFPEVSVLEFCSRPEVAVNGRFVGGRISDRLKNIVEEDWSETKLYAIGNPQMVEEIEREAFDTLGVSPNNFFCEKFISHEE